MERSIDRIKTTHCGSLARPHQLLDLMRARVRGEPCDTDAYDLAVQRAVVDCVARQVEVGLDVVSDGEQGKTGHAIYIGERLSGFETRPDNRDKSESLFATEEESFPEYYEHYFSVAMLGGAVARLAPLTCTGPIAYRGQEALRRDLDNLRTALNGVVPREAFVAAIAPSGVGKNQYYDSEQEYLQLDFGNNLPQLVKVVRDPDITGVSLASWVLALLAAISWGAYGFVIHKFPVSLPSVVLVPTSLVIVLRIVLDGDRSRPTVAAVGALETCASAVALGGGDRPPAPARRGSGPAERPRLRGQL